LGSVLRVSDSPQGLEIETDWFPRAAALDVIGRQLRRINYQQAEAKGKFIKKV